MQFYFLSVVLNLLSGIALSGYYLANRFPGLKLILPTLDQRTTRLSIGVVTALVGFFKLFLLADRLRDQLIIGDFLPAVTGIVVGGALALAVLRPNTDAEHDTQSEQKNSDAEHDTQSEQKNSDAEHDTQSEQKTQIYPRTEEPSLSVGADGPVEQLARLAIRHRIPLGLAGIAVSLLHFLFPRITFF